MCVIRIVCRLLGYIANLSLQRRDVVSAIHADRIPGKWVECRSRVHTEFSVRTSNSSVTVLPRVLEKIPVMLFVGDQDLICNYVGVESMIQAMHWNGETGLGVSVGLCQLQIYSLTPISLTVAES